jgi:hypothetical protein
MLFQTLPVHAPISLRRVRRGLSQLAHDLSQGFPQFAGLGLLRFPELLQPLPNLPRFGFQLAPPLDHFRRKVASLPFARFCRRPVRTLALACLAVGPLAFPGRAARTLCVSRLIALPRTLCVSRLIALRRTLAFARAILRPLRIGATFLVSRSRPIAFGPAISTLALSFTADGGPVSAGFRPLVFRQHKCAG